MTTMMRATLFAAATAAATLFAQPVLSATVQPRLIVSDVGERRRSSMLSDAEAEEVGDAAEAGDIAAATGAAAVGPPWLGVEARRLGPPWLGYRGGVPRFYGGYGCPWGYRWSYRWGCVPYGYGRPVVTFGFGYGGW